MSGYGQGQLNRRDRAYFWKVGMMQQSPIFGELPDTLQCVVSKVVSTTVLELDQLSGQGEYGKLVGAGISQMLRGAMVTVIYSATAARIGESRYVSAYDAVTGRVTVSVAFGASMAAGDVVSISLPRAGQSFTVKKSFSANLTTGGIALTEACVGRVTIKGISYQVGASAVNTGTPRSINLVSDDATTYLQYKVYDNASGEMASRSHGKESLLWTLEHGKILTLKAVSGTATIASPIVWTLDCVREQDGATLVAA